MKKSNLKTDKVHAKTKVQEIIRRKDGHKSRLESRYFSLETDKHQQHNESRGHGTALNTLRPTFNIFVWHFYDIKQAKQQKIGQESAGPKARPLVKKGVREINSERA